MDISSDKHIKDFFKQRDITNKNTQDTYLLRLRKYCEFTNKTPTELVKEAEDEEDQRMRMKYRKIKENLLNFKMYMQDQGMSYNTIKTYMATIIGFYNEFELDTPHIKIKNNETKERTTNQDIVGKKHIKKILKKSNIKYRSIILLMSSSGMGGAEVRNLTYQNFLESIAEYYEPTRTEMFDMPIIIEKLRKENNLIFKWQIFRQKTGHPYTTFSTPEANQAILDYLEERNAENKSIRKIDDPLFLSGNTKLNKSAMMKYFTYLNDSCNLGYSGKSRFFSGHKLRKFFASTLTQHRMPELYTRWLLGHNIDKTVDAYFKPNINAIKKEYTVVIPHLSMENVEAKVVTTKEYDYLVKEVQDEKRKRKEMEQKIENIKDDIMGRLQANKDFHNDLLED